AVRSETSECSQPCLRCRGYVLFDRIPGGGPCTGNYTLICCILVRAHRRGSCVADVSRVTSSWMLLCPALQSKTLEVFFCLVESLPDLRVHLSRGVNACLCRMTAARRPAFANRDVPVRILVLESHQFFPGNDAFVGRAAVRAVFRRQPFKPVFGRR